MLRIGLTGGIGAGKSTVSRALAAHGAVVVDADAIAREVVEPGTPGLAAVVEAFGEGVLTAGGRLDRAALGSLVFADEAARLRLNAIVHPLVGARSAELMARVPDDGVLVHDVPLLVENAMGARYHLVVVVDAPVEQRIERLVTQRGMTPDDARARVAAQAGDEARRAAADVWLENTGSPQVLAGVVDALWENRLAPFAANLAACRPAPRDLPVAVVPADPAWPGQARRALDRIGEVAGARALRLDHIGSTAVPGLAAKDVLDLQVVVADLAAADALADDLAGLGYPARPGDWWDDDLDRLAPGEPPQPQARLPKRFHMACDPARPVNLHVRTHGSPAWRWALEFRDYLRAHPQEQAAYVAAKRAAAGSGIEEYVAGKHVWTSTAIGRARAWAAAR